MLVNGTEVAFQVATDDVGRELGQFLATENELTEVSESAARIAGRRVPKGMGNPDLEDALRAAVALASYVGRQVRIWQKARSARRSIESAETKENGGEQSS